MPRRAPLLLLGAAAAVAGGSAALRRADAAWASVDAGYAPDEIHLPTGQRRTVTTDDDARLAVLVAGQGPTVVLSHCWTGGPEVWAPVAHRLIARGHRVVLYDQRGHGASTVGADGLTIRRLGSDLRAVLEAVDATDAVLAGHSMGGMAVQSLAAHHREAAERRAVALVLVATAATGVGASARHRRLRRAVALPATDQLMRSRFGHMLVRDTVGAIVSRDHLVTTRDLFCACDPGIREGWLTAMQAMDLRDGLADLQLPVTVTVGTRDRLTPLSRSRELARLLPAADLDVQPDLGHMLPLEAPDHVAELITRAASDALRTTRRAG